LGLIGLAWYNHQLRKKLKLAHLQLNPETKRENLVKVTQPETAHLPSPAPMLSPSPAAECAYSPEPIDLPGLDLLEQPMEFVDQAMSTITKIFQKPVKKAEPLVKAQPEVKVQPVVKSAPVKPILYERVKKPEQPKPAAPKQKKPGHQSPLFSLKKKHRIGLAVGGYLVMVMGVAGAFVGIAKANQWQTQNWSISMVLPSLPKTDTPPSQDDSGLILSAPDSQVLGVSTDNTPTAPTASPGATLITIHTSGKGVKLHSAADATSSVVKIVHQDTVVQKLGHSANWIHVTYENPKKPGSFITGWVSAEFTIQDVVPSPFTTTAKK
jgi:hypothetical protein